MHLNAVRHRLLLCNKNTPLSVILGDVTMKNSILLTILLITSALVSTTAFSDAVSGAKQSYNFMAQLKGDWKLLPASQQEGKTTKHKLVAPLVGTDKTAMSFKVIGKGSTVQENLLPGTKKEMATMYHCDKFKNCSQLQAKHYCAKQNQPEFVSSLRSDKTTLSLDCDMNNPTCQSKEGHVHKITHQLIDTDHLKTTYTIFKNGKRKKDSIYHFARVN